MILRHAGALDRAIARKARILLGQGKNSQPATRGLLPPPKTMTPGWRTSARSWESTFRLGTLAVRRCSNFKN
jgi:hypothetical protein